MTSSFTWLDHSEIDRRRMLDVIDAFQEPETRDELGLGTIRDALADLLFAGNEHDPDARSGFLVRAVDLSGAGDAARGSVHRRRDMTQLKDVFDYDERARLLADLHELDQSRVHGKRVLIFDDLYRSGATLNSVADAAYDHGGAAEVFALTI